MKCDPNIEERVYYKLPRIAFGNFQKLTRDFPFHAILENNLIIQFS